MANGFIKNVGGRALQGAGIGAFFGGAGAGFGAAAGAGLGLLEEAGDFISERGQIQRLEGIGQLDDPLSSQLLEGRQEQLGALEASEGNLRRLMEESLRRIQEGALLAGGQSVAAAGQTGLAASGARQAAAQQAGAQASRKALEAEQSFERDLLKVAMAKAQAKQAFAKEDLEVVQQIASQAAAVSDNPAVQQAILMARSRGLAETDPALASALAAQAQLMS